MLKGKIALITGASRGIGLAIAHAFAKHGATLLISGRAQDGSLEETARQLKTEHGGEVIAFAYDVTDDAAVKEVFQSIHKRFGHLDILVNNAGIMEDSRVGMISMEKARRQFDVNALGTLNHMQWAARIMAKHHKGSIINISSIMGRFGYAGKTVYSGSKAAVIGMTLAAAKELAPQNIRVNALATGYIATDLTRDLTDEQHRSTLEQIPLGRIGTPEEVANAALFLASDLSSYITGQVLGVDGGMRV